MSILDVVWGFVAPKDNRTNGKVNTMQTIAVDEFGGRARLEEAPVPEPAEAEVLVRVRAAGVNQFDWNVADGILKDQMEHTFPLILGFDAAGTVERIGDGVEAFGVGDEVFGLLFKVPLGAGTYAEYVTAPAAILARKPSSVGFEEAAALPIPGLTAMSLVEATDPKEGETVLVVGATGGVGSYAVQMAARRGARVIATARPQNEAYARSLGAHETVDHTVGDLIEAVRSISPEGVDVVIDTVSDAEPLGRLASSLLGEGGHLATTQYTADVEGLAARGVKATNVAVAPDAEKLRELARMVDAGELTVGLEKTVPLQEASVAIEESRAGHVRGRMVLRVN